MTFAWPHLLWLLLVPAALFWWELTHRRRASAVTRPKILRAEAGARSLQLSTFAARAPAGALPRFWLCAGLALAVVAVARPQWGRLEQPVFDQSREILLAVDLSRSMLAEDVKPSRLDRAKLLIQSLLEKLAGERVGLVVFAGTAFLQSPLSADYEILREFLPALGPDFLPQGGSNYGALLETSLQAFGASSSADRFLIVLSDGEATDDDWRSRISELKTKEIRVIALGVGTAAGAMIPDGSGGLVKDERGAVVLSRLETATLQELARETNGVYRDASAWVDLAALVRETIETGRKGEFVEQNTVRQVERFQWPLALGLWCLLVSFCYEFPVRPRPRQIALRAPGDGKPGTGDRGQETGDRKRGTGVAAVRSVLLFCCLLLTVPSQLMAQATAAAGSPEPLPLTKIVTRLSASPNPSARDWAELARETVNWGSRLKSEQSPVPEGPVRDALTAVNLGSRLDSKVTDWQGLREELEALLEKNEQEDPPPQEQDKNEQQQNQQNQDRKSDQQNQDQSGQPQSSPPDQQDSQQQQDPSQQPPSTPPDQKPPGEPAFGDMEKQGEPPPPPPQQNTQKVGGTPDRNDEAPEQADPALALPLQKLEQLRHQDSPAELFQLMEGERKPTKKTGKDW